MVRIFDMTAGEEELSPVVTSPVNQAVQAVAPQQEYCELRLLSAAESEEQRIPRPRPWLF
ncbi:hypothetical protein NT239_03430 [Chitinibacter sp. SCUT-21]|uniref:hypothetical protein n=1 Tax=Chitinibacter sp. SCUT-21 TaxID=2970891 RepID=UPI0035A59589